jgi:hypothetical protein
VIGRKAVRPAAASMYISQTRHMATQITCWLVASERLLSGKRAKRTASSKSKTRRGGCKAAAASSAKIRKKSCRQLHLSPTPARLTLVRKAAVCTKQQTKKSLKLTGTPFPSQCHSKRSLVFSAQNVPSLVFQVSQTPLGRVGVTSRTEVRYALFTLGSRRET